MVLHTNLLGRKVVIDDDNDAVPEELQGRPAMIGSVYLDAKDGTPRYTLVVQLHEEPLRILWDTDATTFGPNK